MDYSGLDVFSGISNDEVEAMARCFHMRSARYGAGETVERARSEVGVVLSGAMELTRIDYGGNRTILERLAPGGVFGEELAFAPDLGDAVAVVATEESEALFMEYGHIMKRCPRACSYHSKLVQNMFRLVAGQSRQLSRRVEILSRRSIRDKLLCCLRVFRLDAGSDTFELPMTLSALAEYISSDRSAMMRELKKLRAEGIVSLEGRTVTLRQGEW